MQFSKLLCLFGCAGPGIALLSMHEIGVFLLVLVTFCSLDVHWSHWWILVHHYPACTSD